MHKHIQTKNQKEEEAKWKKYMNEWERESEWIGRTTVKNKMGKRSLR